MLFALKENGQGLVEYALILLLIALVVILVLALVGDELIVMFDSVVTGLQNR